MEITNLRGFERILSTWLLSFVFVAYSFYDIRNRKIYTYRKIIWGIACCWLIIDGFIYLLYSKTNIFLNRPFPVLGEIPFIFIIAGMILNGFTYLFYHQWNLMCIYQIHNKTVSLGKQLLLQKGSAILMYVMLAVHFVLYGMFFYDYYGL